MVVSLISSVTFSSTLFSVSSIKFPLVAIPSENDATAISFPELEIVCGFEIVEVIGVLVESHIDPISIKRMHRSGQNTTSFGQTFGNISAD